MNCNDCAAQLSALHDNELTPAQAADARAHLAECAECSKEYETIVATSRVMQERLERHHAPDMLRARIAGALREEPSSLQPYPAIRARRNWSRLAAAGIAIAVVSSALTHNITRNAYSSQLMQRELLASHVRSLMPGHLIDVVSTDQHTVKPWFNGRVDISPSVPKLDSLGFVLTGGRLDYIRDRAVPVVVYMRRQHVVNLYIFPDEGRNADPAITTANGYHVVAWRDADVAYRAVSDVDANELMKFATLYRARE